MMQRSTRTHLRTTLTGSLPRLPELVNVLFAEPPDSPTRQVGMQRAVQLVVAQQAALGLDTLSDGEQGKRGFLPYVLERLTGLTGEQTLWAPRDLAGRPEVQGRLWQPGMHPIPTPACTGQITYSGQAAVQRDIVHLRAALERVGAEEGFLCAASPGAIAHAHKNAATHLYADREAYLYAISAAMREEYLAITGAGLLLQIDSPDLAMDWHLGHYDSKQAYRTHVRQSIQVLQYALRGIPQEQIRVHVCWGNIASPHDFDLGLEEIIDLLVELPGEAIAIESANRRHQYHWEVIRDAVHEELWPKGKILIAGCIDTKSGLVDHPRTVSQQIALYAHILGVENVIAGTDCGFETYVGNAAIDGEIAWAKLAALVTGARLADKELV